MEKKKKKRRASSKTTKKTTQKIYTKKRKAFTLLELLLIVLGASIIITVAIPFIINYFTHSNKETYVEIARNMIDEAKKKVNIGTYEMFDQDTTYYIESTCIKKHNIEKSSYGEFKAAYVIVTFNGKIHTYYWTSVSDSGHGIKTIVRYDRLRKDYVEKNVTVDDIKPIRGIDGRSKIVVVREDLGCKKAEEIPAEIQVDGVRGEVIS